MFEILGALVGGAYYGGKYLIDKRASRRADDALYGRLIAEQEFKSKFVPNREEMSEIKHYVYHLRRETRNAIYAEDFKYALGENWEQKSDYRFEEWFLRLVLADRGKIDEKTVEGIYWRPGKEGAIDFRFAQCVEKRLHKAGVKEINLVCDLGFQWRIKIEALATGGVQSLEFRKRLHEDTLKFE